MFVDNIRSRFQFPSPGNRISIEPQQLYFDREGQVESHQDSPGAQQVQFSQSLSNM